MSNNHNIDRLFQESFRDFEAEAPKGAWENIEKELIRNKNKGVIPLWQRATAVAALVAVLILVGSQWFINPESNKGIVDAPVENTTPGNNLMNPLITPNPAATNEIQNINAEAIKVSSNQNIDPNSTTDNFKSSTQVSSAESGSNSGDKNKIGFGEDIAKNSGSPEEDYLRSVVLSSESNNYSFGSALLSKNRIYTKPAHPKAKPIDDVKKTKQLKLKSLIEVANNINSNSSATKEKQKKSLFIKPQISPVFYGNLGSGSAISPDFDQNSGQGQVNMSYGLNLAYELTDKIKIRTGINKVDLNYNTADVFVFPSSGLSSFSNVDVNSNFESSLLTSEQISNIQETVGSGRIPTEESQLQQQLGFIEIPVELEYKLLDRIIDINIIGGASTLLLNNNSLDIQTGSNSVFLGQANNVNNLSFSTNFAIGLDYEISKKFSLNLEPTFKYQFNTFQSGTTNFQPYFLGVYSGVVFQF